VTRRDSLLRRLAREVDGQDLIEYGLLAALISIVAVLAITNVGSALNQSYQNIEASIP
jgi:Flp pilus assembly pilin Flp